MLNRFSEDDYIHYITKQTNTHNMDNISRTNAYQTFYFLYPDIQWALLASIVSRNAGWNMTDLSLPPFLNMLGQHELRELLWTYERGNWLIFSDAYPQLLVYQMSVMTHQPLFHLLHHFNVSTFMISEWEHFWKRRDHKRLMRAQIVNEQNLIQDPVIDKPFFKQRVFQDFPYLLQNLLGMNAVLFPVRSNHLYGFEVKHFTRLTTRIKLGKQMAEGLFTHSVLSQVIDFITHVQHTGTRRDYERFFETGFPHAYPLRRLYPVFNHTDRNRPDWYIRRPFKSKWMSDNVKIPSTDISEQYYRKRHLMFAYDHIKRVLKPK